MKFCGGLRLSVAVAQCYAKNKNSPFPLTFTESVFHWNVHHTNPSTGNSFPNRGKAGCLLVPMKLADCKTPALKDVCDKKLPTKEEIYNYYFFNGDIKDWKATPRNSIGSLTQLSREMSNGKFELNGAVSNWVESNWTADEIEDERYQDSLKDAYNSLSLDDRKKVDSDADGEIDCILYVTFPDSGGYMRGGVDHTFTDDTGKTVKGSEYSAYGISDEPANKPDKLTRIEYWNSLKKIVFGDINGQFHELGHVLGLTDLYTVNNDNDFALGRYALMMFTGWNNELPHYTPITKIMWGWANITKTINEEGKYTIKQSVGSNEIFKISKGFKNGEYLLIENRGGKGSESARQQGLYIWHVDENLKKSTVEERELYPTNDNVHDPANYLHPTRLSFIQADGQFKLERRGWSKQKVTMSDSEIFSPGTELRNVLGKTNKDFYYSGVSVSDIKINVNKTITFKVNFDMFPVSNENETCETTCLRNSMTCNEDFMKKLNKYYSADICKNMIREKDSGANFNFNVYDRTDLPCGYKINTNSNANADVSGSGFCGTKASNYKSLCSCSKLKSKGIKRVTYFIDNWALNEKCTGKSSPSQYNVIVKRDLTRVQAYNFCLKSDKCLGFAVDNGADKYGVNNYEFYEEKTAQSNAPVPLDCDKVDPNYMLFVNVEKQKARNLLPYWVKNEKCTGLSNVNDYLLNFSKIMSLTKAHLLCKESDKCVGFSYDVTGKHYQIYELKNTTVINGPAPITCNNPISKFKLFAKPYVTVTEIQLQESLPGADQKLCSGTPDPSKFETYSFQPQLTRYGAYEKCRKDNDCVGYASLKAKIGHQYYGYTAWNFYKAKTGSAGSKLSCEEKQLEISLYKKSVTQPVLPLEPNPKWAKNYKCHGLPSQPKYWKYNGRLVHKLTIAKAAQICENESQCKGFVTDFRKVYFISAYTFCNIEQKYAKFATYVKPRSPVDCVFKKVCTGQCEGTCDFNIKSNHTVDGKQTCKVSITVPAAYGGKECPSGEVKESCKKQCIYNHSFTANCPKGQVRFQGQDYYEFKWATLDNAKLKCTQEDKCKHFTILNTYKYNGIPAVKFYDNTVTEDKCAWEGSDAMSYSINSFFLK